MVKKTASETRGKTAASAAAQVLCDPKASKVAKSAAASSLTQSPPKKPKLMTSKEIADAVRKFYSKAG